MLADDPRHYDDLPRLPALIVPAEAADDAGGAELRVAREALAMSARDVAIWLGVSLRSVQRWEADSPPAWVPVAMDALAAATDRWVEVVARHRAEVVVYGRGWRVCDGRWVLPESWWLALVGRARRVNPEVAVRWGDK